MDIDDLRIYVAVVEAGGVSAAARRLHLSQPSVSQTIRTLEKHLGVQLLTRSSTGVAATAAGMTLLHEARAVIARYDQALSAMSAHSPASGQRLRIGVPLEAPVGRVSSAIAATASAFPQSTVEVAHLSTAEQLDALRKGELEVGLVRERPAQTWLDASVILTEALGVLVNAEDAVALGLPDAPLPLDRLAGMQWLGFPRASSPAWYDELTAILRSHGIQPAAPEMFTQHLIRELKLAVVSTTGRFTLAPPGWRQSLPDSVRWYPLEGDPLVRRTWVVWPAATQRRDIGHLVAQLEDSANSAAN